MPAYLHDGKQLCGVDRPPGELIAQVFLHSVGGVRHVVLALKNIREKLPTKHTRIHITYTYSSFTPDATAPYDAARHRTQGGEAMENWGKGFNSPLASWATRGICATPMRDFSVTFSSPNTFSHQLVPITLLSLRF